MKLIIRDNASNASEYLANYIIKRIRDFDPTPERLFVLGLPTGSSPEQIYKFLVRAHKDDQISFANVVTFNMDEYVNLPEDHPESYHSFMYKHFFSHIDINPSNVHLLNGNASNLVAECMEYEQKIRAAGGIELFLGGIGPDGHIAFNEPGSSLKSRTRVATLANDTIRANSRFFDNDISKVPKQALTVGVQTVMEAREVALIVSGAHKALALQKTVEGSVSQMWTASALQMHENATIVCDEDSTDEMLVKTVKYFKSIEQIESQLQIQQPQTLPLPIHQTQTQTQQPTTPFQSTLPDPTTKINQWRGSLKELHIDTDHQNNKSNNISSTTGIDELTPDSMSSRLADSAIGMDRKIETFGSNEEKEFGMGSRVSTFGEDLGV